MKHQPSGEKTIEERIGARKASRFIPIVVTLLTIVAFLAHERHDHDAPGSSAPEPPAVTEDLQPTETATETEAVPSSADGLEGLKSGSDEVQDWLTVEFERIQQKDGLGEILFGIVQVAARLMMNDLPVFIWWQMVVAATIFLYALFPGLAGMFYRRSFGRWFWFAVVVLFAIEWTFMASSSEASGEGIGYTIKERLNAPPAFYAYLLGIFLGLLLIARVRTHNLFRSPWRKTRKGTRKNIVICFDGSWNHPGQKDHGNVAQTNVFKLFNLLKEEKKPHLPPLGRSNANRVKRYGDKQIAFYYHGVGNEIESSSFMQICGGAFGLGADAISERAYLDLVRVYQPGDRIFIFGFSRGAAIARLFAGVIGRRGVTKSVVTLRLLGRMRPILNLFGKFDNVKVAVLGCWDTVGAFGISKSFLGIPFQKINLLKDLTVGDHVERAYHLVALDETRVEFEPTLMNEDPTYPGRVIELWFSGNHGNVGGGFATDKLSDGALAFILEHVSSGYCHKDNGPDNHYRSPGDEHWGLYLTAIHNIQREQGIIDWGTGEPTEDQRINPDPCGRIRFSGGPIYEFAPRKVPINGIIHDSVFERMADADAKYAPDSLFILNRVIANRKEDIRISLRGLLSTDSITPEQAKQVADWRENRLTVRKWSTAERELRIDPASELLN